MKQMQPFTTVEGIVAPLDRVNVDTDQIIPKQFLKEIGRTGFGKYLFYDWRYDATGKPNQAFVLNEQRYHGAKILLTRGNFGCGSSREHAVWALADYGFKVIIAPSFADILYNNCFKNAVLPVSLSEDKVNELFKENAEQKGYRLEVDLLQQEIHKTNGDSIHFYVDSFRKKFLLEGLDDIELTLKHNKAIQTYEERLKLFQLPNVRAADH